MYLFQETLEQVLPAQNPGREIPGFVIPDRPEDNLA
jgi:hypothetical protein